jgi:hypothetical protein
LEYWRGKDYAAKVRGLYGGAPKDWKEAPKEILSLLLPEDHLTCLAEDEQGAIWIGTWQNGMVIADQKSGKKSYGNPKTMGYPDNFVTKILCLNNGDYLIGFYGGGIVKSINPFKLVDRKPLKTKFNKDKIFSVAQNNFPNLPAKIKPPTAEELRTMYYKLKESYRRLKHQKELALNDDWRTRGDYLDRYGKHSAVLCAQSGAGLDLASGHYKHELRVRGWIGRNNRHNDQIRRWVHWVESEDQRVLQCFMLGGRKQSEWDDHKEAYPIAFDGPHLYGTLRVPPGKYYVSLYFFNKDGHNDHNRFRDYLVTIKTCKLSKELFDKLGSPKVDAEQDYLNTLPHAATRIVGFWGGAYKRFYIEVQKDEYVVIKVDANYSFNTILSGIFFDQVGYSELKQYTAESIQPPRRELTNWAEVIENPDERFWWGCHLMDILLHAESVNTTWYSQSARKYLLEIIREFVINKNGCPIAPDYIDVHDKEFIRSDMAKILDAVQLFKWSELTYYRNDNYATFGWLFRTQLGRMKLSEFKWDGFNNFFQNKKGEQSW